MLTLPVAQHAVVLATHAWAHEALACAGRLIDVSLMALEADPAEADAIARRWGCLRLWRTTRRAAAALVEGEQSPLAMRLWARHLNARARAHGDRGARDAHRGRARGACRTAARRAPR